MSHRSRYELYALIQKRRVLLHTADGRDNGEVPQSMEATWREAVEARREGRTGRWGQQVLSWTGVVLLGPDGFMRKEGTWL